MATAMASAATTLTSFNFRHNRSLPSIQIPDGANFTPVSIQKKIISLKLSSSQNIASLGGLLRPIALQKELCSDPYPSGLTVIAAKGYKMKTHKASAKRFRVTGKGKIVRRRAGKQHLLGKKNTKRKNRLSKVVQVNRSDYDNVIGALPYLKVNRKAE